MQKINYIYNFSKFNKKNSKTVLFLHGWGGSTSSFLFLQKHLSFNYNTLNIDFYGFGNSPCPDRVMDTYDYALSIYELLVELDIKNITIICHSFGGRVAILLSSIFNIKVEKLILISSAGLKPKRNILYYLKVYTYKALKKLANKGLISKSILSKFGSSDYKQLSQIMKSTFVKVVNQNLEKFLNKIEAKTLIVWGAKDKSTPLSFAKIFHKKIKNSQLVIYKNSAHFCYIDNATNFVNLVENFLLS